jgi:hypothetical protein
MIDSTELGTLPAALAPLISKNNWVLWKLEIVKNKPTKVPYQPNGRKASTTNPATWSSYAAVIAALDSHVGSDGIGFVLTDTDFAAFDLDKCRDKETGILQPWSKRLVERCGSYAEITVSGTGIRIIGYGTGEKIGRKQKVDDTVSCETYRKERRYIVMTGNVLNDAPLVNIDVQIEEVVAELDALEAQNRGGDEDSEAEESSAETELPTDLIGLLHIPNEGAGEPHGRSESRNGLLFSFLLRAIRARVKAQTIMTACLDPAYRGNAIYEHVAENRGRPYVEEQIRHARAELKKDADAEINTINKTHALVLAGDKAVVMKLEKINGQDQFRLVQVDAFRKWFANRFVTVSDKPKPIADYWITHKDRRQYEGIEFAPTKGRDGYYNLWQGFAVKPRQGDCSKFLAHLEDNVASGNATNYKWISGWFAQIVQQVHVKMGTALCLRGPQGVGKTIVGQIIGSLLGRHYQLVSDPRYVTGQFNSHMASLVLLHADEAFWAGDRKAEGKLKDLITGLQHLIEFKRIDPISVSNYMRLLVSSNSEWAVPAGFDERRFAIFDVGKAKKQDHAYFAAILEEMNNGGREALLHHLLNFDLSQVDLRTIPQTEALLEQIVESATAEQSWWYYTLKSGELPWGCSEVNVCPKRKLFRRYVQHAQLQGVRRKAVETKIGGFLNKYVGGLQTQRNVNYQIAFRGKKVDENGSIFRFPSLKECRKKFADIMGKVINWNGDNDAPWEKEPEILDDDEQPF